MKCEPTTLSLSFVWASAQLGVCCWPEFASQLLRPSDTPGHPERAGWIREPSWELFGGLAFVQSARAEGQQANRSSGRPWRIPRASTWDFRHAYWDRTALPLSLIVYTISGAKALVRLDVSQAALPFQRGQITVSAWESGHLGISPLPFQRGSLVIWEAKQLLAY